MIRITKEESIEARKKFPNVHIAITSRGKTHNRKRYYLEENRAAMGWLKKIQNERYQLPKNKILELKALS